MNGPPCTDISLEPTIFETDKLPDKECHMATVANGYLGTIIYSDNLYMNGLYNGQGRNSHRAMIPSPCNVRVELGVEPLGGHGDGFRHTYALNVTKGIFTHQIKAANFSVQQVIYAHQLYVQLLVCEISIHRNSHHDEPITVNLTDNFKENTTDLELYISTEDHVR
ncbi:protein-glucosylgalactosylhydroxylysine glucosidase-like [Glandiceps talaboti]